MLAFVKLGRKLGKRDAHLSYLQQDFLLLRLEAKYRHCFGREYVGSQPRRRFRSRESGAAVLV